MTDLQSFMCCFFHKLGSSYFPIKKKILIDSAFNLQQQRISWNCEEESKSQVMLLIPVEGQQTEMLLSKKLMSSDVLAVLAGSG